MLSGTYVGTRVRCDAQVGHVISTCDWVLCESEISALISQPNVLSSYDGHTWCILVKGEQFRDCYEVKRVGK